MLSGRNSAMAADSIAPVVAAGRGSVVKLSLIADAAASFAQRPAVGPEADDLGGDLGLRRERTQDCRRIRGRQDVPSAAFKAAMTWASFVFALTRNQLAEVPRAENIAANAFAAFVATSGLVAGREDDDRAAGPAGIRDESIEDRARR